MDDVSLPQDIQDALPAYHEKWRNVLLAKTTLLEGDCDEAFHQFLSACGSTHKPEIRWFTSPLSMANAIPDGLTTIPEEAIEKFYRGITDIIAEKIPYPLVAILPFDIINRLNGYFNSDIASAIQSIVGEDGAEPQTDEEAAIDETESMTPISTHAKIIGHGAWDAPWACLIDFCVNHLKIEELQPYTCFMPISQSCSFWLPAEKTVYVSRPPSAMRMDAEHRLHANGEPAIDFQEEFQLYYWHGVRIPSEWGKTNSEHWNPKWVKTTKNVELRRILFEGIGYDRVMAAFKSKLIAQDGEMELRQFKGIDVEPVVLLKVACPSTDHFFTLRVPPNMTNCEEARRWTLSDEDLDLKGEA